MVVAAEENARLIAVCAYGQVFYHAHGRVVDENNYYYTNTSTAVAAGDFNLGKCVSGTFTNLATEAVDLTSGKWALIMLSISGSTLKAYREGALRLTATDTSLTSGKFGAWFHVSYFTTNPLYMFLRAPSSPSLKPVAYFEIPIVGSGTSDDPYRVQMPESIVEDPVLGKRNLLALTHSALIPIDSATGKPIYGTAIVRVFDQPDRDPTLYPIDKCIEALKGMRGVRRLTREEAIALAKKMDDKLHDADLMPTLREKIYIRGKRQPILGVKMPKEIGFWIVEGHHVDVVGAGPNMTVIGMGHNGDWVVLTGKARFRIEHKEIGGAGRVETSEVSLEKGQLYKVVNIEETPKYPGNWDTYITLIEGEPPGDAPSPAELFELKKAWLRQNVFLGEYALTGGLSALAGGVIGYLVKR
jgi:hypothetical protein